MWFLICNLELIQDHDSNPGKVTKRKKLHLKNVAFYFFTPPILKITIFVVSMKEFLHKSAAITMALLVLFTTMSFTVNMHYCGDILVDYSFTQNAASCGMDIQPVSKSCDANVMKTSCCKDKQLIVEGQDNVKLSFETFSLEQQTFVATFFYSYTQLFESVDEKPLLFKDYSPPLLTNDISVLYQTFLI